MVPRISELYPQPPGRRQRGTLKNTFKNLSKNCCGDWGHQLRGGEREGSIRIMFQNMRVMGNASDQSSQHKLDILKNNIIIVGIKIIGISEVNINWSKITI